jgi:hypothetical protein
MATSGSLVTPDALNADAPKDQAVTVKTEASAQKIGGGKDPRRFSQRLTTCRTEILFSGGFGMLLA